MEKDPEITGQEGSHYTTHFRAYDSRIGRWWSVDPKTAKLPWESPFVSMGNNPIMFMDPNGDYFFGLIGSTKEQRNAARRFANKYDGEVIKITKKDISVAYTQRLKGDMFALTEQRFNTDGSYGSNSSSGFIDKTDIFTNIEFYINSEGKTFGGKVGRIGADIAYSSINSPWVLITHRTVAGAPTDCEDRVNALVDVAPGLLLKGMKLVDFVEPLTKPKVKFNIDQYNNYVKKSPDATVTDGLPKNMKFQERASKNFKINMDINDIMKKQRISNKAVSVGESTAEQVKDKKD